MTSVDFNWFRDKILEEVGWVKRIQVNTAPEMTPEEWVNQWISWADSHKFLQGTNTWAMLIRPVFQDHLASIAADYFGTLFEFDLYGEVIVVDFAYGPGHYPEIIRWLKNSGCNSVIWNHAKRSKIHQIPLTRMPSVIPFKTPEDTGKAHSPVQ